jgi:transposase
MERFGLRDNQWDRIKDILPGREGHVGGTAPDNRPFVEGILYRFRTGIPWRDSPPNSLQRFWRGMGWSRIAACHVMTAVKTAACRRSSILTASARSALVWRVRVS